MVEQECMWVSLSCFFYCDKIMTKSMLEKNEFILHTVVVYHEGK